MTNLFELPELLTLDGEKFTSLEDSYILGSSGFGCDKGCVGGCANGCDSGGGTGKKPQQL